MAIAVQTELDFRTERRGGARAGAGRPRKEGRERKVEHGPRPSHPRSYPVHVTLRAVRGLPSLRQQRLERIIKRALHAQREAMNEKGAQFFQLVHFSIQSDHLHLIVEANDKRGLARGVMGLEIRIAKRMNRALGRKGSFWADRYHRHDLKTPRETRNALRYVLMNLHKHTRVSGGPFADPRSSASSFDGFTRGVEIIDEERWRWPRIEPRTWLLGTGWRRRGLIDPADGPRAASTGACAVRGADPLLR